jgi:AraC-like DNA-binding protein
MAVTDVAFATGFEDSNYMARQFRRLLDVSPGAYRKGAGGGVDVTPSSAAGYSAQPRGRAVRKERT